MQKKWKTLRQILRTLFLTAVLVMIPAGTGQAAGRSFAEIKKQLGPYESWVNGQKALWESPDVMELICPYQDLSDEKVLSYTIKIAQKLKGKVGTDYTKILLEFPYTYDIYEKSDGQEIRLWSFFPYYSGYSSISDISYRTSSWAGNALRLTLTLNGRDPDGAYSDYNAKLMKIVNAGKKKAGSDQKALVTYFHDWLLKNVTYSGSDTWYGQNPYVALMEGTAVCGGYATTLYDLCNAAGIPTLYVSNAEANHAWNQVYVNKKWYSVDVLDFVKNEKKNKDGTFTITIGSDEKKEVFITSPSLTCDQNKFITGARKQFAKNGTAPKTWNVTFKNGSKTVKTQKVFEGESASAPKLSKKGYVLSWSASFKNVKKNLTIKAVWTPELPKKGYKKTIGSLTYKVTKSAKKTGTVKVVGVNNKALAKYTVPSTIKIGQTTFTVTGIGTNAFQNCKKAKSFILPKTITSIEKRAFTSVSQNAAVSVPKKQYTKLSKLLRRAGLSKSIKIKQR